MDSDIIGPQVEITSPMLRAGLAALLEWRSAPLGVTNPTIVKRIYTAMALAKGEQPLEPEPEEEAPEPAPVPELIQIDPYSAIETVRKTTV